MSGPARVSAPICTLALLKAAVAELDAIIADELAPDAADRLNGVAGLVEEAMGELEGRP